MANDVATLDAIFRDDPRTIRYGGSENPLRLSARSRRSAPRARRPVWHVRCPDGDQHLWPRSRRGFDAVPSRDRPARSAARCRPGCAFRRLARRRRACQHDRRDVMVCGITPPAFPAPQKRANRRSLKYRARQRRLRPRPKSPSPRGRRSARCVPIAKRLRHRGNKAAERSFRTAPRFRSR